MPCTRRQLLTAAALLAAAGCRAPGDAPERVTPGAFVPKAQRLDPRLVLSLPPGAVSAATLRGFGERTGVRLDVRPQRSDEELLLDLAGGRGGTIDIALVQGRTLAGLVSSGAVEPLATSLLPNLHGLLAPFDDPPYDRGSRHSVPRDYTTVGYASAAGLPVTPPGSWIGFFRLARAFPGRVAVPDDPETVLGAALVALGYGWNSDRAGEVAAAGALLRSLRRSLVVGGRVADPSLRRRVAALCTGASVARAGGGVRFTVPVEGSVVRMRSFCLPLLAPDPVSAHAFLNYSLEPGVAAAEVRRTLRASPVGLANYLLPPRLLTDEAVYPPAEALPNLTFADVSDAGMALRRDAWRAFRR